MRTFNFLAALIMAVVCVSFSSCSNDDDENLPKIEQANLIGKWQSTWEKIHKVENGKEVVTSDESYTNGFLEFKADGTCIESSTNSDYKTTSRWSLKDNKITLSYSDDYTDDTSVLTVNELTAEKLILAFEDWDNTEDGGLELDDITTTTYKKIK